MSSSFHVGLVSMPWPAFNRSSIQLGCLGAYLRENKVQTTLFHPYLQVAKLLGGETYQWIATEVWLCEALYSAILYPEQYEAVKVLALKQVPLARKSSFDFDTLVCSLHDHMEEWVDSFDFSALSLLGFSVCLNQLLATLCAVKYVRHKHPTLPIVLGGSSTHPQAAEALVDLCGVTYVIWGEGEQALLGLCDYLQQKESLPDKVYCKSGWGSREIQQLPDLSALPVPDYSDYMTEGSHVFPKGFTPVFPLEFSRGCWWGKCVFCNLNLQWHGYRFKKFAHVQHEIMQMNQRYQAIDFTFTDNALPVRESRDFFSWASGIQHDFRFFAEIRGSQRGDALRNMRCGGLTRVQVGIESLSSSLLERLNKGMTVIENLAMMRDGVEYGVEIKGNLIIDFPSSTEDEMIQTLENLDFVLPFAPLSTASFFLGLQSYVDGHPREFGILRKMNHPNNRTLFPADVLKKFPQIIRSYQGDRMVQKKRWAQVTRKVAKWQKFHDERGKDLFVHPPLSYRDGGNFIQIRQERILGKPLHHKLKGMSRSLYLYMRPIRTFADICAFCSLSPSVLQTFLDDLVAKKIVFTEDDRYLALAVRSQ